MKKLLVVLISFSFLGATATADTTVSLANLAFPAGAQIPAGTMDLIQVTGALGGAVQGGSGVKPASSDTRTAYFWASDNASTAPTYGLTFGSSWPVIFHDSGSLVIDPSITASVTLGAVQDTGLFELDGVTPIQRSPVLVDNRPIYQFCSDNQDVCFGPAPDPTPAVDGATRSTGIYGTWYGVAANGVQVVPEPSTGLLFAGGLGVFAAIRRRSAR